jgi:hypothetical protein
MAAIVVATPDRVHVRAASALRQPHLRPDGDGGVGEPVTTGLDRPPVHAELTMTGRSPTNSHRLPTTPV